MIDQSEPLTEEQQERKDALAAQGFTNWNKRDFLSFIKANERYGRNAYPEIAAEIESKSVKEVKEYASVFWKRYKEIDGYDRYISQIEAGEERIRKLEFQSRVLHNKIRLYRAPLQQLKISYNQSKGKVYTEEEDRFLLVMIDRYGLGREDLPELIRREIRDSALFRFDCKFDVLSV